MCRVAFSSPQRQGSFDSQDFLPFIRAANDITEIVFVPLPRPWTPGGNWGGSQGSGWKREGKREKNWDRINKRIGLKPQKTLPEQLNYQTSFKK